MIGNYHYYATNSYSQVTIYSTGCVTNFSPPPARFDNNRSRVWRHGKNRWFVREFGANALGHRWIPVSKKISACSLDEVNEHWRRPTLRRVSRALLRAREKTVRPVRARPGRRRKSFSA